MKKRFCMLRGGVLLLALSACTEAGEMTGMGAAAGGVVGAGLGAIVGSQTGSAGAGLAIGAVAGAGAGAAIGNVLEAQDQAIHQQDEAIERQEQVIRAQRGEIDELRKLGRDNVRFRSKPGYKVEAVTLRPAQPKAYASGAPLAATARSRSVVTQEIQGAQSANSQFVARAAPAVVRDVEPNRKETALEQPIKPPASNDMTGVASVEESSTAEFAVSEGTIENDVSQQEIARAAPEKSKPESADCLSAEGEFQQASAKNETPDKLFHLRRALRLCPDESRFHASLGDVYKSLGRQADAQFEYQEALKLSPGDPEVKEKLGALGSDSKEQY